MHFFYPIPTPFLLNPLWIRACTVSWTIDPLFFGEGLGLVPCFRTRLPVPIHLQYCFNEDTLFLLQTVPGFLSVDSLSFADCPSGEPVDPYQGFTSGFLSGAGAMLFLYISVCGTVCLTRSPLYCLFGCFSVCFVLFCLFVYLFVLFVSFVSVLFDCFVSLFCLLFGCFVYVFVFCLFSFFMFCLFVFFW